MLILKFIFFYFYPFFLGSVRLRLKSLRMLSCVIANRDLFFFYSDRNKNLKKEGNENIWLILNMVRLEHL